MPANKNALIRYKTIDRCLRNRYRRWTLDDLVDACCDALYDMEGITKGVCARTVQMDIQIMRSDKLGYNAPIVVYDKGKDGPCKIKDQTDIHSQFRIENLRFQPLRIGGFL